MLTTTDAVYERGMALYNMSAVEGTKIKGVFAVGEYLVDTRSNIPCQCGYARFNPDLTCKHIVASLRRMLDDLMYPVSA